MRTPSVARLVQVLVVAVLLLAAVSAVAQDVWLSGPSALWTADVSATTAAVQADFNAALGGSTTITTVAAPTSPAPVIGVVVTFTAPAGTSDADALAALKAAPLTNLNNLGKAASVTTRVLDVLPTAATKVSSAKTALSGPSFFWLVALQSTDVSGAILVAPLEVDVQNSVDSAQTTYLVHILTPTAADNVNASAMFVDYEWWSIGSGALSADALTTQLNAAPLTAFNSYVSGLTASGSPLYDYRGVMPSDIHFTRALYPDPAGDDTTTAELPVVSTTTTGVLMYFSGESSGWDTSSTALSDAVAASATTAVARGGYVNNVTVNSMTYETSNLNNLGGLVVTATVSQGAQANSLKAWDGDEVASVLLTGDYATVIAQYTGTGTAAIDGVALEKKYGFKCTAGCVGMIVMSAIIVFFMIVAIVLACVCLCCCAMFSNDHSPDSPTTSSCSSVPHEPTSGAVIGDKQASHSPDEEL